MAFMQMEAIQMKTCSKCNTEKSDSEYYARSRVCKPCYREKVKNNRDAKKDYYREYDRARGNRQPPEYLKEYRSKYPNKYKAHNIVNNSVRDGKLFPENCEVCGTDYSVHAHHDDYLKPLNVRWLCAAHHKEWHQKNGEALNP